MFEKPKKRPAIVTVTGDPGTGKTVLASTWKKPVFLNIGSEEGMMSIPAESMPDAKSIKSPDELWAALKWLGTEKHEYSTLVIDSVTELENIFIDYVLKIDTNNNGKPPAINTCHGGYGAGRSMVASMHGRLRRACGRLNEANNMAIVFIAHSETSTIDPPDAEPYSRYELRLHSKSMAPYVDNVDMVAYLKLDSFIKKESKKAISSGERVAICHAVAANVSKNRFNITEPLAVPFNTNPFAGIVPGVK